MAFSQALGVLGYLAGLQPFLYIVLNSRPGLSAKSEGLLWVQVDLIRGFQAVPQFLL